MDKNVSDPRHFFIELIAYWEGKVNANNIASQFNLSRQQCSAALQQYQQLAPLNLEYNASLKAYIPNDNFRLHFISGDVLEYLQWVHTGQVKLNPSFTPSLSNLSLALPPRKVSPIIMRAIVSAIREQKRIEVDYVSLNNPNREGRVIAPHSFINTGMRWHLRAWCEKSAQYRDFVLSRFRGEPELLNKTSHTAEQDTAWNTQVKILLQPDPRLLPEKREVLENDYQMQNGQLEIMTKGCLVNYLLRELQINTKMLDGTPEAQQLVCVNLADIKAWLFEG